MRPCPVCECMIREEVWSMTYQIPDGWPLPSEIRWYECNECGMLYGDGNFDQAPFDDYYRRFYGYGVNSPANTERLRMDAVRIIEWVKFDSAAKIVDFGGAGDDGRSIVVNLLHNRDYMGAVSLNAGDPVPAGCDLIFASHVLEHIYDLPSTMQIFSEALRKDGTLVVDIPDATGLLRRWQKPILDFNTKHLNHFTLRNFLDLAHRYNFELTTLRQYEMEFAPAWQMVFKRLDVADASMFHVKQSTERMLKKLQELDEPVNVWGMGDITWHLLSRLDLPVLNYIDNDPAYRNQTFKGKPVLERPDNDAPIVILAQGQRQRLIANIKSRGIQNRIIEI